LTGVVLPEPKTPAGRAGLDAVVDDPADALLAFDYDGTLSPIVEDPSRAVPHPDVVDALAALSQRFKLVAIVTGRPVRTVLDLGGFEGTPGLERFVIVGQYGLERWDAQSRALQTVAPPPGVDAVRRALPGVLQAVDLADAAVEDKGLALVVHVRRLERPAEALARLEAPLTELARRAGLVTEPGRNVIELRPPGMDKGQALRGLVEAATARAVMFVGDDLGDLAAFDEVERLRSGGTVLGLLVCSASDEVSELAARADLVVDGPPGVAALLASLRDATSRSG
jgi:trehalose 6-phosphate phosphatase